MEQKQFTEAANNSISHNLSGMFKIAHAAKRAQKQLLEEIIEDLTKLPTGMFDSTPYAQDLLTKYQHKLKELEEKCER